MSFADAFITDADEIKQHETRQLAAELAILDEYDALRSRSGHDYGSGQRNAELSRRRRELDSRDPLHEIESPTKEELSAAFERVGRPKLRRAEQETFRRETPATKRTLRAWAMVERFFTGARIAGGAPEPGETPPPIVEPPATTEEAIARAAGVDDAGISQTSRELRERQEKRAAREARKAERRRMTAKLEVGDYVRVTGSHEGGREQSYTGTVRRINGGTVLVDDAEQTDGAGTPTLHYCSTGSIFKTDRRSWLYSEIDRGGEKWQLVEHRSYGDVTLATLIRLPGTMTRIFASQIASDHYNVPSTSDYSGPCEARLALAKWLDAELPRVPNRSDADHARAEARSSS